MGKEKIRLEYMLKAGSGNVVWSIISTPSGLETWFADKITFNEEPKAYFELKMVYNELTGDYMLEVTDWAEPDEKEDVKELWDSEIEKLKRVSGL